MVYVDSAKIRYRGRFKMSHMLADTVEELTEMAEKIGMKPEWFQPVPVPHFDLCQSNRAKAVKLGAKEIDWRETAVIVRRQRRSIYERSVLRHPR